MELALQVSGPYDEVLAAARWAEAHDFAAVALPDHYLMALERDRAAETPAPDALIQLAGLARDTEDIELVTLVSPITFRHPAVYLKSAIEIDRMSGGRFSLGIGTGWLDIEHEVFGFPYPDLGTRFELMEEALAYLRAGLDPAAPGFTGNHFRLEPFPIAPQPVGVVRLVVGGRGPKKTPTLAGRYADEFNAYPADPGEFAARLALARSAATEAGRDPDRLLISSAGQVRASATRAEYEERLAADAAEAGMEPAELEAAYRMRNTPRGTYEEVRAILDGLEAAGVRRFYFQVGRFDPVHIAELLTGLELAG